MPPLSSCLAGVLFGGSEPNKLRLVLSLCTPRKGATNATVVCKTAHNATRRSTATIIFNLRILRRIFFFQFFLAHFIRFLPLLPMVDSDDGAGAAPPRSEEQRAEIALLSSELTSALSTLVGCSPEANAEIMKVLSETEREVNACKAAADSMQDISEVMTEQYLPAIRQNELELTRLFAVLDAMEDVVVPALLEDLAAVDAAVTTLEKRAAKKAASSSALNTFLNFLTSGTPSTFSSMGFGLGKGGGANGDGGNSGGGHGGAAAVEDTSDIRCKLHDPADLLRAIGVEAPHALAPTTPAAEPAEAAEAASSGAADTAEHTTTSTTTTT